MTARTTARSIMKRARWLCVLALAGCDDPDVELAEDEGTVLAAEDEAQDAVVIADSELREVCDLAELDSQPPVEGPDEFTDEADPALGTCSTGSNDYVPIDYGCGSCRHPITGESGRKVEHWWQYCYKPPSPPACGCYSKTLWSWSCEVGC